MRGGKCIPLKDRQRLIEAHEQGEDYVVIAHALGLKRDTAYRIIKRGANEKSKRGGIRAGAVKVTTEIKNSVVKMVEKDACITLVKIAKNIHNEHGVQLSRTTINQVLSNELFSMKKIERLFQMRETHWQTN